MSEQAAEVNWQAIAEQRDRELRALGERKYRVEQERDALRAELARMRAPIPTLPQWLFDAARVYPADKFGVAIDDTKESAKITTGEPVLFPEETQ
jgi:hypothetical protein